MSSTSLLSRFIFLCAATFAANALWAARLPSASGRIVGAVGALVAAGLLVAVGAFPTARARLLASPPALLLRRRTMLLVLVPFLAPAVFLHGGPVVAFWRFDGRTALLVAWLASITLALVRERVEGNTRDRRVAAWLLSLFVLFSAGTWLTVVMDSGIASFIAGIHRLGSRPCQSDLFTTMATVWESNPPAEHLFLGWRSQENFDHRIVYANHVHPYLMTMYGWITAARRFGGLTLWEASNTSMLLPVGVLIVAFGTLLARSGLLRERTDLRGLLNLFLAMGVLLTTWRLWVDLVRFNSDNPYPLLAAVIVLVYALLLPPMQTWAAAIASAALAALSPVNTPAVILPILCLFGQGGSNWRDVLQRNRSVAIVCGATFVAGAVSYLEPRLLISWKGYHPEGSSFLFRSGLDGDTSYFTSLFQAAVAPCPVKCCYARTVSELLFPAIIPAALFGPLTIQQRSSGPSVGRAFLFLATPYLVSLILFPQSVSIHPYLYDHLLIIPAVVAGLVAMLSAPVEQRLTGASLLAFLLIVGAVLMSNLIGISQGLSRAVAVVPQ